MEKKSGILCLKRICHQLGGLLKNLGSVKVEF